MRKHKYHTETIEIASGTAAKSDSKKITFDSDYKHISGISAKKLKDGGMDYIEIGFKDNNETFIDLQEVGFLDMSNKHVFEKPLQLQNHAQPYYITFRTPGAAASNAVIQVVFTLERENGKR